ncbi:LPS-assembly protein LptD [Treponema primitia]|uniref:LPS-assembly protein LptD n=1 Tax=Treponema primitia TaxID=88058 RepID=UPI001FE0B5C7|nr:LPS-assembly protein LptD [Treponema primitia]
MESPLEELTEEASTGEPGAEAEAATEPAAEPVKPSRDAEILELDIKTSTLSELAAWCRILGLSEGGTREVLAARLREHFLLAALVETPGEGPEGGPKPPKVITIEAARSTEYFTLEVVDEEYARLRGNVVISLKDGDAVHRIKAWELLYNRSRNLLSATGGVEYVKESGDTIETFRGESITVDLDNWSSIFMDGVSERSLSDEETTYRFEGNVISRSAEEATVLSRAEISNAGKEEAYWSISASKLWLLPGSDWAILNGFLKVGEIPVLYIPFFFFPADEVIFHPVLGYRTREGTFLQTTTYILGRPQASSSSESSSISKILGNSSDMEKTQHGIFLRSTGKKSRDPNTTRLSVLMDFYTNLGMYMGTNLALPKKGVFGEYNFSLGVGRTRDIYKIGDNDIYTPFPRYDGTSDWNSSHIGDWEAPFRFRMINNGSLSGKYGSFNWNLPHYSDPFVDRDFLNRSEEMDYINMLKEGNSTEQNVEEELTKNVLGSYEWRLSGSSSLSLPILSPYVSNISISSLSSFVSFNYRNSTKYQESVSPNRTFFFPDKFTIYSLSASIQGTPLTLTSGQGRQTASQGTPALEGVLPAEAPDPFMGLGIPVSPWGSGAEEAKAETRATTLTPPVLNQRFDLPSASGLRFSIAYQLTPTSATELKFNSDSSNWVEPEDIEWDDIASILTSSRMDSSTTFTLADLNNIVTTTIRISGSGSWQEYGYINEEAGEYTKVVGGIREPDQSRINSAKIRAMGQSSFTTSSEFTETIRPFYQSTVWGNTNFQYTLKGLIAKSVLEGTEKNDPKEASWDVVYGDWYNKDDLETHRAAANIQASVMNKVQTLTVTADLPPEDGLMTGDATARIWVSETNFNGKVKEPFDDPVFDPLRFTETLRFNTSFYVSQNVVYDPEKDEFDSMTSNLSFYGLTASYTMTNSNTYTLEPRSGSTSGYQWVASKDPSFNPREFRLGYNQTFKKENLWRQRLAFSLNLNSALNFNLQQYTNSSFNFGLNFTLGIGKFIDITLGTTSANSVIFRYFRDWPIFDVPEDLPRNGEANIFTDLINSFRFDDEELRRSSGFKLKSFHLALLHYLGDWNAKLDVTLSPYLPPGDKQNYKFNTELSFVVQWLPISEIKTEILYNKDDFEFK